MSYLDDRRSAAIQRLPPLPRALFLFHNFYGVDEAVMAEMLGADGNAIAACLAEARAMIHAHACFTETTIDSAASVAGITAQLQQDYRQSLEAAFAKSGYPGEVAWPAPPADIAADETAAAAFIVALLPIARRRAVARARRADVAVTDLWRYVWPWRKRLRRHLLLVTDALQCAGWQPFDEWLAGCIATDRCYPYGYAEYRRRRRPLPEERPLRPAEESGEEVADTVQIPLRLVDQPKLTRHVWILFHHYGRPIEEIAWRLSVSCRCVERLRERADYAIGGWPYPSLAHRIRFGLMVKRLTLERRWKSIRSSFYD